MKFTTDQVKVLCGDLNEEYEWDKVEYFMLENGILRPYSSSDTPIALHGLEFKLMPISTIDSYFGWK